MHVWKLLAVVSLFSTVAAVEAAPAGEQPAIVIGGSGSKFLFKPKGGPDQTLVVMVVPASDKSGGPTVRYFLDQSSQGGSATSSLTVAVSGSSDPNAVFGFFKPLEDPTVLPRAVFENAAGLPLIEALLGDPASLAPHRVGTSTILVPAGYLKCKQYRVSRDGQTIDFWVSDRAGPLGLVQLNATGPRPEQNFELILLSLLSTHS